MYDVLLWVVLYTHLNDRSPYISDLTGLSACCMQAPTLLQVTSAFLHFKELKGMLFQKEI